LWAFVTTVVAYVEKGRGEEKGWGTGGKCLSLCFIEDRNYA
jgi:hypothetical protein